MTTTPKYGEWQPIETAPKDGEAFVVYVPGYGVGECYWGMLSESWWFRGNRWSEEGDPLPTHWMPLPPPPKE